MPIMALTKNQCFNPLTDQILEIRLLRNDGTAGGGTESEEAGRHVFEGLLLA